jgi:putative iron-regulated protein
LLESLSPEAALAMEGSLAQMMAAVEAIPAPFDQAIQAPDDSPERAAVEQAIEALEAQASATVRASEVLGLRINLEGG